MEEDDDDDDPCIDGEINLHNNKTSKYIYVKCVDHMLFITEMFQLLSRSSSRPFTRLQGVTSILLQHISEPLTVKSVSHTSYIYFDVHMSVHRKYISKVQPTRWKVFSIYLFL